MTKILELISLDGRPALVIGRAAAPKSTNRFNKQPSLADIRYFEAHPRTMSRSAGYHVQFQDDGELSTVSSAQIRAGHR